MRVLYWTEAYWPMIGGAEVQAVHLITGLRARGHDALVMTDTHGGVFAENDAHDGVRILRYDLRGTLSRADPAAVFGLLEAVFGAARRHEPDLIHVGMAVFSSLLPLAVSRRLRVPLVVTQQVSNDAPIAAPRDSMLAHVFGRADRVVFCSEAMRREMLTDAAIEPRAHEVVYNGVIEPFIEAEPLAWDPPVVVGLGRLSKEKGFDTLIRAFARVRETQPDVRLELVGDGPERQPLETLACDLGIGADVRFMGWVQPDLAPSALNRATVVAVPSRLEAFGLSAVEAQMMARPVVAARVGGLAEVVADGETGLLVDPEDADALADGLLWVLHSPERAAAMGRAGARWARERFRFERMVDRYDEIYRSAAGPGRRHGGIEPVAAEHG